MLDDLGNQGMGLHSIRTHNAPRILTVASHADAGCEWPLLWSLCSSWTTLGYGVTVLDGTVDETPEHPGLAQLLASTLSATEGSLTPPAPWRIYPARQGLEALCASPDTEPQVLLDALGAVFHSRDVVVLFVPVDTVVTRLPKHGLNTLLAVMPQTASVLSAYQALKLILQNTLLQPSIISVLEGSASLSAAQIVNKSLQECAMNFLGHQLHTMTISSSPQQEHDCVHEARDLALRLLETATLPPSAKLGPQTTLPLGRIAATQTATRSL